MGNLMTYYYDKLGDVGKDAYKKLYEGYKNYATVINLPAISNIWNVHYAVKDDHPELFYVNWQSCQLVVGANYTFDLFPNYIEDRDTCRQMLGRMRSIAHGLKGDDDIHTMRRVNDYLGHIVLYDPRVADTPKGQEPFYLREDHNVIGPLINHMGVCEGIARAAQLLLRELDVECTYMTSYVNEDSSDKYGLHAWTLVKYQGQEVKMDATWDVSKTTDCNYKYFCVDPKYWG